VATYTPVGHLDVSSSLAGVGLMVNGKALQRACDLKQRWGPGDGERACQRGGRAGFGGRTCWAGRTARGRATLSLTLGAEPIAVSANYHLMNYLSASSSPIRRGLLEHAAGFCGRVLRRAVDR